MTFLVWFHKSGHLFLLLWGGAVEVGKSLAFKFGLELNLDVISQMLFYKIGCISLNNGPIYKIRNLACSGPRPRSDQRH